MITKAMNEMITKTLKTFAECLVEPLMRLVDRVGATLLLGAGLTLIIGAVALGVVVPHHAAGVVVAALGSACGAVLMAGVAVTFMRSMAVAENPDSAQTLEVLRKENDDWRVQIQNLQNQVKDREHDAKDVERDFRRKLDDVGREKESAELALKKSKDEMSRLETESKRTLAQMADQRERLTNEVIRLEGQRINVDGVSRVLRLQLLSVEARLKDWPRKCHSKEGKPKGKISEKGDWEFLGLIETQCTANFGVDLSEVRLTVKGTDILVTGMKPRFQGFENLKTDWKLKEVRCQEGTTTTFLGDGVLVVHKKDPRITDQILAINSEIQNRLNEGVDFKHLDEHIVEMAEAFIDALLAPLGKKLKFQRTPPDASGLTMIEFIQRHNERIDQSLRQLPERRSPQRALPRPSSTAD